jgi:hypothetical protein
MFLPTDICNLALDSIGVDVVLGDIEDGTKEAAVCLRSYRECLLQLLRGAHWQFARKQAPLLLLGDATGQTANVGTSVIAPWMYEYAYPTDCAALRFVTSQPAPVTIQGNISLPSTPLMSGLASPPGRFSVLRPARFLVARDSNYPPQQGQEIEWQVQGVSPQGRTVICTNVPNAVAVYTSVVMYPSEWDALFRAAFVAYLASAIALPLTKDRKEGIALRRDQIAIAKSKIEQARVSDGNETWSSSDIQVDWLNFRNGGSSNMRSLMGGDNGFGDGLFGGWVSVQFADGSAY